MSNQPTPFTTPENLFEAVAVLGQSTQSDIEALISASISPAVWQQFEGHTSVEQIDNAYTLTADACTHYLHHLEQQDPVRYKEWHFQSLRIWQQRLLIESSEAVTKTAERHFAAAFERLANQLMLDDPAALLELVTEVADLQLSTPAYVHQQKFFHALALRKMGRYAAAVARFDDLILDRAVEVRVRARAINSQAVAFRLLGRPDKALAGYEQSLAIWEQLADVRYQGMVLLNMGTIAYELRQYERAEELLKRARSHFAEIDLQQWMAVVENELGLVYRDRGRWGEALTAFEHLIAQREAAGAEENVAIGLLNKAEVLIFQGNMTAAHQALIEAESRMQMPEHRIDVFLQLGLVYQAEGSFTQAFDAYHQAEQIAREIGRREFLPHVLYHLGDSLLAADEQNRPRTVSYWHQAIDIIEDTRQPVQDEGVKISLLGRWQQIYEALLLSYADIGDVENAFYWAERARARAFAELLTDVKSGGRPVTSIATVADIQVELAPKEAVIAFFATGVLEHDLPLLRAIPAGHPLRSKFMPAARILRFTVTDNQLEMHDCRLDPNFLTTASPRGQDPRRFLDHRVAAHLHRSLLAGLPTAKQITLVPHGPLHQLPFAAIGDLENLAYAPSGTILVAERRVTANPLCQELIAVYDPGRVPERQLSLVEQEARLLASAMNGRTIDGATVQDMAKLADDVQSARWLHFACHGWFNHNEPMLSYLEIGHAGRVTAGDILQSWQLAADLVTLSACQTGVSRVLRGDEPFGLVRAFLHAGARAVLVTQWVVEDLPTFLLMRELYRRLRDGGGSVRSALSGAQDWLRQLTRSDIEIILNTEGIDSSPAWGINTYDPADTPFSAPRHWAAFLLVTGQKPN